MVHGHLDLNNIDGSITDYLSEASITTSESQIELEIDVEDTYQDALQRMQNAADKFLEKMQQLFAEELEILIAKKAKKKKLNNPKQTKILFLQRLKKVDSILMVFLDFLVLAAAAAAAVVCFLQLEVEQPHD